MNALTKASIAVLLLVATVIGANWWSVGRPVSRALAEDPRNSSIQLSARHQFYVMPSTVILDLRSVDAASPADLGRLLFQAAEKLKDRSFTLVLLARQRQVIYQLEGEDFRDLGQQFAAGQNPIYLIRKLPSKLYEPDGTAAFGSWSGGLLGVVGEEMEDYTEAMTRWATGM